MPIEVIYNPNVGDITGAINVGGGNAWFNSEAAGVLQFNTFETDGVITASYNANVWTLALDGIVPPANGGLGVNLGDPEDDRILFWDDSASSFAYLDVGPSLQINDLILDTIQDLRITASPTFAGLTINTMTVNTAGGIQSVTAPGSPFHLRGYNTGTLAFENLLTITPNNPPTISLALGATVGGNAIYRVGGQDVALADGGLGTSLADPNADRIFFWDDSAGVSAFLAPGNSITISGTTLDTIQDIRTSASPVFAGLTVGGKSFPTGGIYAPVYTNISNVASFGTVSDLTWSREHDMVHIHGRVSIDPTAGAVVTEFRMSIPVASNFTLFTEVGGSIICVNSVSLCAGARADSTNDQIIIRYVNTAELNAQDFSIHVSYRVV